MSRNLRKKDISTDSTVYAACFLSKTTIDFAYFPLSWLTNVGYTHFFGFLYQPFSAVRTPSERSTSMTSPAERSHCIIIFATRVSTLLWMKRRSGRAPKLGS